MSRKIPFNQSLPPIAAERSRARPRHDLADRAPGSTVHVLPDDVPDDIVAAELREFLAADEEGCEADPIFKERLRLDLWRLLRWRILPLGSRLTRR